MSDIRNLGHWPDVDFAGMRWIGPIRPGQVYRYKAWRKASPKPIRVKLAASLRRLRRTMTYVRRSDAPALYFAYGSNLDLAQMRKRCPGAEPVRAYRLIGWRLVFSTYADILPDSTSHVEGALYRTTRRCVQALDRYEGIRSGSYRRVTLRLPETDEVAFVYLRNLNRITPPSDAYLETIKQGFQDWQIPLVTLGEAVRMSYEGQGMVAV